MSDPKESQVGYIAKDPKITFTTKGGFSFGSCTGCWFNRGSSCLTNYPCTAAERKDKKDVIFVKES